MYYRQGQPRSDFSRLKSAIKKGQVKFVREAVVDKIFGGFHLGSGFNDAFRVAIVRNHIEIVKMLLNNGILITPSTESFLNYRLDIKDEMRETIKNCLRIRKLKNIDKTVS
jgi:hypothetical protein